VKEQAAQTDPATIDPGEELLGRVGISHALARSEKSIRVFKSTPELADDIDAAARRFVTDPAEAPERKVKPFDYSEALKQLSELREPNHEAFRYLDAHLISAYLVAVQRAVKYLAPLLPRSTVTTMTTTRNVTPSDFQIHKFRRIYDVADDVTTVFRALNDGTLVKDQAIALQVMFPTVFEALKFAILREISVKVGSNFGVSTEGSPWMLPYAKDQLLQTMLLTSMDDPAAVARLQKNFADAKAAQGTPAQGQPDKKPGKQGSATQTPIDRAAQ
jgi:hypothetical protein